MDDGITPDVIVDAAGQATQPTVPVIETKAPLSAEVIEVVRTSTFASLAKSYATYYTKHVAETKAEASDKVQGLVSVMLDHGDAPSFLVDEVAKIIECCPLQHNDTIKNRNRKIWCSLFDMLGSSVVVSSLTDKLDETTGAILMNYVNTTKAHCDAVAAMKEHFEGALTSVVDEFVEKYGSLLDSNFIAVIRG